MRRIHCKTYCYLGFLLEMQKRGFTVDLSGPVPEAKAVIRLEDL